MDNARRRAVQFGHHHGLRDSHCARVSGDRQGSQVAVLSRASIERGADRPAAGGADREWLGNRTRLGAFGAKRAESPFSKAPLAPKAPNPSYWGTTTAATRSTVAIPIARELETYVSMRVQQVVRGAYRQWLRQRS